MKNNRTDSSNVTLDCGTSIIEVFAARTMTWKQMLSEWIDNSFGAGAKKVDISWNGDTLLISDDGQGCEDLREMESPARSLKRTGNLAAKYGIGGVMSQIRAGRAGLVEVSSITREKIGNISIDWSECMRLGKITADFYEHPNMGGQKPGTRITIHGSRRVKEVPSLVRDLGYCYAGKLRQGCSITLRVDGEKIRVKPYTPPPFSRRVDFGFEFNGHHITGFCGLVERGKSNPYPGWSFHWAYRFLGQFYDPANGRPSNRIYSEVYLPEGWSNIGVTKDEFSEDAGPLMDALAVHCAEIIEAAGFEAEDASLCSATKAAEDLISRAIGLKGGIKGARPGCAGKKGTVEPTGTGSEHRNFKKSQPGSKVPGDGASMASLPSRVVLYFDDTMEEPYLFAPHRKRGCPSTLTLNSGLCGIANLMSDPKSLAMGCLPIIAYEIAYGSKETRNIFAFLKVTEYKAILKKFLSQSRLEPDPEVAKPRKRQPVLAN